MAAPAGNNSAVTRTFYPWITALVLVLLLGNSGYQQLNNLLAGMHVEGAPAVTIATLTGGPISWSKPSAVEDGLEGWEAWEQLDRSSSPLDSDGQPVRLHESPASVVTGALALDMFIILPSYVVLLFFVASQLRLRIGGTEPGGRTGRLRFKPDRVWSWLKSRVTEFWPEQPDASPAPYSREQEVSAWRQAVRWLTRFVLVGAIADLIENIVVFLLVHDIAGNGWAWVLVIVSRAKWWSLIVGAGGLVYVAMLRPNLDTGKRWATSIPSYLRGLRAVRVSVIAVLITLILISGPLFGDQMKDVLRRLTWLQVVILFIFVLMLAGLAGLSARRVRLRIATGTNRWEKLDYHEEPEALTEAEKRIQEASFWTRARRRTTMAGLVVLGFGILGALLQLLAGFGLGFVIPAGLVVLLAVLGAPLPKRGRPLTRPASAGDRIIPEKVPRLLAASIPLIVGLGIIAAVVPEYALSDERASPWTLLLAFLVAAALIPIYLAVARFRNRMAIIEIEAEGEEPEELARYIESITGAVLSVLVIAGLWAFNAAVPEPEAAISPPLLIVLGIALMASSHVLFYFFAEPDESPDGLPRPSPAMVLPGTIGGSTLKQATLLLMSLVLGGMVLWLLANPIDAPQVMGGVGVALAFAFLLTLGAEVLSRASEASAPPKILEYLGMRRTPMFILILAWLWIAASWLPGGGFHSVATVEATEASAAARDVRMEDVWARWLERNELPDIEALEQGVKAATRTATPMVFVSAWGGGIRAAVWTAYALDCAFEPHISSRPWSEEGSGDPVCHLGADSEVGSIIAMSGISGGSLGFAEYFAQLTSVGSSPATSHTWVRDRLEDDYLAPALARLFYVDIPAALVGASDRYRDRADILRQTWQKSWLDDGEQATPLERGIYDLWATAPELPLAVMNGTSMNDGCSINASVLHTKREVGDRSLECTTLAPFISGTAPALFEGAFVGTHDVGSYVCADRDLSLASAALTSARFPVMSPTGRYELCGDGPEPDAIFTTDGGQLEPSATLSVIQLWEALEGQVNAWNASSVDRCIVPVLIHLENGFSEDVAATDTAPPNEWLDPNVFVLTSARGGLVSNIRQREALEFSEPLVGPNGDVAVTGPDGPVPRYAFIRTRAHPGASAPLGWTLSQGTLDDLAAQLGQNAGEYATVASWLSGTLTCEG